MDGDGRLIVAHTFHILFDKSFFIKHMIALRKLIDGSGNGDKNRESISLVSLLENIKKHAHLLSRGAITECEFRTPGYAYDTLKVRKELFIEGRNRQIDQMSGVPKDQRRPEDTISINILEQLIKLLNDELRDVRDHVNKFIAHAASPESRKISRVEPDSVTLNHLYKGHALVCKIANLVSSSILYDGPLQSFATPQFDQFEYYEKPLVPKDILPQIREEWDKFANECDVMDRWGVEEFLAEIKNTPKS